jgi:hypothetical protein
MDRRRFLGIAAGVAVAPVVATAIVQGDDAVPAGDVGPETPSRSKTVFTLEEVKSLNAFQRAGFMMANLETFRRAVVRRSSLVW